MRRVHLHARSRNVPALGLLVEFGPGRSDQLTRTHKSKRHKLQCQSGVDAAHVSVNGMQQRRQLLRTDAGIVAFLPGFEYIRRPDIGHGVTLGQVIGNGIAHNLAARLQCPPSNIEGATTFNLLRHIAKGGSCQFVDRPAAQFRENVGFKTAQRLRSMGGSASRCPVGMPATGHSLEGTALLLLDLPIRHRVHARLQHLTRRLMLFSRLS